ncbi:MAG: ribbon-helix-helix protein, CopG family [Acidobacteriota bacterium]|nr:ribbon-helix-helix protein, CopG family [Acidobacteriota bacterium]MDE3263246.1 ribbon-helix-helix protein, CopG family [Acidobacteriota bacterium]
MTVSDIGATTNQITARLPTPVLELLDNAARELKRSRAEIVRQAIEYYLEDFDDLTVAVERLRDPGDPVLDWDEVKRDLFGSDQT